MAYRLPMGVKPYIDMLGPGYVKVPVAAFQGSQQPLLDQAFKIAKQKFFQAGHGFPHLSDENVDVRVWPGHNKLAFCFGTSTPEGDAHFVFMAELISGNMLKWMRERGLIKEQEVH